MAGKHNFFHELVVEVLDVAFLCTYLECLFTGSFEVLLLSNGSREAENHRILLQSATPLRKCRLRIFL
jgi:hypothetical protein